MRNLIKYLLKLILPQGFRDDLRKKQGYYALLKTKNPQKTTFNLLINGRIVSPDFHLDYRDDYVRQFNYIVSKMAIDADVDYVYPYDPLYLRLAQRTPICSITVDYEKVLVSNLNEIICLLNVDGDTNFAVREKDIIKSIEFLANRVAYKLRYLDTPRSKCLLSFFPKLLYRKPATLDEAIQKLLFYNALFWQMNHSHIGLGRLDVILGEYYDRDIKFGVLTETEARKKLKSLILILGKDTVSKSLVLKGDTGQYILLGGIDKNGSTVNNRLTSLFLDLMSELRVPDPKLILRVNKNTSSEIWQKAIECILTGTGSPLFMNEVPIMKSMIEFGYREEDVWNVGTSACWEPLIIGKSFDQNNPFPSIIAIKSVNKTICQKSEYSSFSEFYSDFKSHYRDEICKTIKDVSFDCSPLFSLFFDDCMARKSDFAEGGAVYSYHGAQVVSLPNTINALLNIKRLVYDEKLYSLKELRDAIVCDFVGKESLQNLLKSTGKKFGMADSEVIMLTNDLMNYTGEVVSGCTCNGTPVKVGFSSPNYLFQSHSTPASLDGRCGGEPFAVHISPVSSSIDLPEILDFASKLDYGNNRINGNVVDFIIPSSYANNPQKLEGILRTACSRGIFELQLNVLDKNTLIDAKAHPDKYPNLIVRVWGFSAYFNDLPEDFKDNLIQRAELYGVA